MKIDRINTINLYRKEVAKLSTMTHEKEKELRLAIAQGKVKKEEWIEILVTQNLSLVIWVANTYWWSGQGLSDLIQAGNLGLVEAAERFDWSKNTYFSSYAIPWIKKEILLSLRLQHVIKTPYIDTKVRREYDKYILKQGIPSTFDEYERCADKLGTTVGEVVKCQMQRPVIKRPSDRAETDDNINDEDTLFSDTSKVKDDVSLKYEKLNDKLRVHLILSMLKPKEKNLITLYYGIGCIPMTYEEIGKKYRKNKQWVHREILKIVNKLMGMSEVMAIKKEK